MGADAAPSFLGSGWAFPPRFHHDGKLDMADGERDVHESLRIILSTSPGERIMHPTFGCGLRALVFESVDESLKARIKDVIARAVALFEPRVELGLVAVHGDTLDAGLLNIELAYRIRATNSPANMVFPFYLGSAQPVLIGAVP